MCIDLEFVPLDGFGVSVLKRLRCFEMLSQGVLIWPWWRWKRVCLSLPSVPGKVKNFMIQTGDFQFNNGDGWRPGRLTAWLLELRAFQVWFHRSSVTLGRGLVVVCTTISQGGESIYGGTFNDEDFGSSPHPGKVVLQCKKFFWKNSVTFKWFWICVSLYHFCASTLTTSATGRCCQQWPIKAHRIFGRFDYTRSGSRKNNGTWGKGGLPRQSHPSQSSKCINHFHFWGPIQIITSEAGSQAETAMDRNSSSLWSGAPPMFGHSMSEQTGAPRGSFPRKHVHRG